MLFETQSINFHSMFLQQVRYFFSSEVGERLVAMETALDAMPERDSSVSTGSTVTTPSLIHSSQPTPIPHEFHHHTAAGSADSRQQNTAFMTSSLKSHDPGGVGGSGGGGSTLLYSSHSASSSQEPDRWDRAGSVVPRGSTPSDATNTNTDYGYYSRSEPRSYSTGSRIKQQGNLHFVASSSSGGSGGGGSPLTPTGVTINTSEDEFFVTAGKPDTKHFYNLGDKWQTTEAEEERNKQRVTKSDDDILKSAASTPPSAKSHDTSKTSGSMAANKRTSFGSVTEYVGTSVTNYKVPSEPVLTSAWTITQSTDTFDSYRPPLPSTVIAQRSNYLSCKSVESFSLVNDGSTPGSRPPSNGNGRYRYTSLRTALASASAETITSTTNPGFKSKSEADLMDTPGHFQSLGDLPEEGHQPHKQPAERESDHSIISEPDTHVTVRHKHIDTATSMEGLPSSTGKTLDSKLSSSSTPPSGFSLSTRQKTMLGDSISTHSSSATTPRSAGSSHSRFRPVGSQAASVTSSPSRKLFPTSSSSTSAVLSSSNSDLLRPVPMVTRTTQVPSPGLGKHKPRQYGSSGISSQIQRTPRSQQH